MTRKVAEALDADFDIEIVEMHHRHKVDAPSGTALMLGKAAADGRGVDLDKVSARGRDGHTGERRRGDIGFASLRGGSVVGDHSVIFAADGELIELTHRAADRGIFARGAVKAALWGRGKGPGLFSMMDVLGIDGAKGESHSCPAGPDATAGLGRRNPGDAWQGGMATRRAAGTDGKDERSKWVGVYIGVLAVLLAICNVGGANATKDATHSNIAAANTWAFFQAKNIRRNSIGLAADDLELMLASQPAMPEEAKKKFEDKIKSYRAQYQSLTTDPAKQEGLDELFVSAASFRDGARRGAAQGPLFRLEPGAAADRHRAGFRAPDHRQRRGCWGSAAAFGALGTLLMLNGFTLALRLPFLG